MDSTPLPDPWDWSRLRCPQVSGRSVTFVNPQPDKGVFVFARIAVEMARRRPDIPRLVVEGRGTGGWLQRTGLDIAVCSCASAMVLTSVTAEESMCFAVIRAR